MKCLYCDSVLKQLYNQQLYTWCYQHQPDIQDIEYKLNNGEIISILITSSSMNFNIHILRKEEKCFVLCVFNKNKTFCFTLDRNFYLKPLDEIIEQIKTLTLFS